MPIHEILDGRIMDFIGSDSGLALRTPQDYRGRVGAQIPTAGIELPHAHGGQSPITHSIANLPSGLSFDATTRAISGNPTSAHATRQVTYTATDSSTPAVTVSVTFEFPVVAASALLTRLDWDNSGYRLSARTTYLLALLESEVDVAFSDADIWRRPPQSGTPTGKFLADDGTEITSDFADLTFTADGENVFVSRIQTRQGSDRVVFFETTSLHFGTYFRSLGSPSLFLRVGNDEQEIPYERAFGADVQFRRSNPDLGAFLRGIDDGTRVLIGVASP